MSKNNKELKKWNGRARAVGLKGSIYIAAYTKKQAIELLTELAGCSRGLTGEINNYFSQCWGNPMDKEETQPTSYETEYGSNGARDYIKEIAKAAIKQITETK